MNEKLRNVSIEDAEIILAWRNDEDTRKNSFSKEIISFETHMKWFSSKLEDENCFMYIMEIGPKPVGLIRIDKVSSFGEISFMIAPDERGKGYGKRILSLAEDNLPKGIDTLIGLVENENKASKKCFADNGFSEFKGGETICFAKTV